AGGCAKAAAAIRATASAALSGLGPFMSSSGGGWRRSVYHRTFGEQLFDTGAHAGDEDVALRHVHAGGLDRLTDADGDMDRLDDRAAATHRVTSALDSHRHDWRLSLERHQKPALLERQQFLGAAARALREDQERVARLNRSGPGFERAHRRFLVFALDRHEPAVPEAAREHRNRVDIRLVDDGHARVEAIEEDRRVDVALMVGAVDGGAIEGDVLRAGEPDLDATQREP